MPSLTETIIADMKAAMRDKNKTALNVLRALKTAITNTAIDKSGAGTELDDAEVTALIRKQIKQRQDSIEQFTSAGREELAENERKEVKVLEHYLPQPMSEEEIAQAVDAAIAETSAESRKDTGKVMKVLQEKTQGRADGKTLSQMVMQRLAD